MNDHSDKRYADLPRTTRAFLEAMDDESVVTMADALRFYGDLSTDARSFLKRAKPRTLKWLAEAREQDIELLDEGINLVRSSRTVGRFLFWLLMTTVGAFLAMSQLGGYLRDVFGKGGH